MIRETELKHYGVRGMKWGHRKAKQTSFVNASKNDTSSTTTHKDNRIRSLKKGAKATANVLAVAGTLYLADHALNKSRGANTIKNIGKNMVDHVVKSTSNPNSIKRKTSISSTPVNNIYVDSIINGSRKRISGPNSSLYLDSIRKSITPEQKARLSKIINSY